MVDFPYYAPARWSQFSILISFTRDIHEFNSTDLESIRTLIENCHKNCNPILIKKFFQSNSKISDFMD